MWCSIVCQGLAAAVLLSACATAASGPAARTDSAGEAPTTVTPRRASIAIMGDPNNLNNMISRAGAGGVPGVDAVEELISAGLTHADERGDLRPQLGEAVPTLENGLWKLSADGRMETTWTIKSGAQWHDGRPVSTEDLVFTVRVGQDHDIPALSNAGYGALDGVEPLDARTVTVRWKQPFIQADTLFSYPFALPLPRHLLERVYHEDRPNFIQVPFWTEEFVGAGPYRLRDWVKSSHMVLTANDAYPLGRPKIDEIEVRFIPDPNTLIANLLAVEVELIMGRSLSLEQAVQARDQWRDGRMETSLSSWLAGYPQMLNPNPPVVADARFRRALLYGLDRQQLVDSLQAGQSMVGHSYLSPREAEYREIEGNIIRYDFDPRRSAELLESLGYARRTDGVYRDNASQRLGLEVRTTGGDDLQEKTLFSMIDYWQRLGIAIDPVVIPRQRAQDRDYRANFPALEMVRQPNDLTPGSLMRYHGSESALPENNYRGNNRMRYRSSELDALIDRFFVTVPRPERTQVLGQIVHHMTDQAIPVGLFYNVAPVMIGNRLQNVTAGGPSSGPAWNAHDWDTR